MGKVVLLSKDIFIFNGINRSLLVDITNGNYHIISNNWRNLILQLNNSTKQIISTNLNENEKDDFESLLHFLNKHKYIFEVDKKISYQFKNIELGFDTPFIFDILFCEIDDKNFDTINTFITKSKPNFFGGFNLILYNISLININKLEKTIKSLPENKNINIYLSNITKKHFSNKNNEKVIFHHAEINDNLQLKKYFYNRFPIMNIGMKNILESKNLNYFYNKTVFINRNGDVVRSLFETHSKVFIKNSDLSNNEILKMISNEEFKELWDINNSKIIVCNDCEYHRVCIDCRTPFFENDTWKKESCLYNPYTSKWKEIK